MVHSSLCRQQAIRFSEVLPGRALQVRVPGEDTSLDIFCCYQYVWRSKETLDTNKTPRKQFLAPLSNSLRAIPQRNTLLVLRDFNMSLRTDMKHVGPCTIQSCRLGHMGYKDLQKLLEEHQLVAANTWGVNYTATQTQGNSVTLIVYAFIRILQSEGPGKMSQPQRAFPVAQWRDGSRHYPLLGTVQHSRSYSAGTSKAHDQQGIEDSYRFKAPGIDAFKAQVDNNLSSHDRSWDSLRETMETIAVSENKINQSRRGQQHLGDTNGSAIHPEHSPGNS